MTRAEPIGSSKSLPTARLSRAAPKGAFLLASSYRLTRKRVYELLDAELVVCVILLKLIPDILLYRAAITSCCADVISPAPEMPVPMLVLEICMLLLRGSRYPYIRTAF